MSWDRLWRQIASEIASASYVMRLRRDALLDPYSIAAVVRIVVQDELTVRKRRKWDEGAIWKFQMSHCFLHLIFLTFTRAMFGRGSAIARIDISGHQLFLGL